MPDIKSALQQALTEWADELTAPTPAPTTQPEPIMTNQNQAAESDLSISEQTFNYVRDNPYTTIQAAVEALDKRGLNVNSTGSLIYQMIRAGMVSRDKDGKLTALHKRYTPVQTKRHVERVKKVRQPYGPRRRDYEQPVENGPTTPVQIDLKFNKPRSTTEGIAALNAPAAQHTRTTDESPLLTAEQVLKTLSVKEAHALYRELQTMFG